MCSTHGVHAGLLRKARAPGVERVIRQTLDAFVGVLRRFHSSVVDAVEELDVSLEDEDSVHVLVRERLDPYREQWATVIADAWEDGAEAGRAAAIQRYSLDLDWQLEDEDTIEALREHGQTAAEVTQQRMTGDIADAIVEAYREGYGPDRIAGVLREQVFPDMRGWEARRVARTEGVAGGNKGRLTSLRDAGALRKTWLARDDTDTRHSHDEADGQAVALGEAFVVGGHEAQYPGDPTLPPGERINCRCLLGGEFA